MCGIAGIFDASFSRLSAEQIRTQVGGMIGAIRHRGPDDMGIYGEKGIGLGSSRLTILDLSPQGHMPMRDEFSDNYIVHNGEVYNYRELRSVLGLDGFKSRTDTEVILKAYTKYGLDCIRHFNGMYAFAIWDHHNKRLVCVRDRIGIKPFFYAFHNGIFYFASEIKSILKCGIPARANQKIIYEYLAYGVYDHSEETFFEGIKQLPPGHFLSIGQGHFSITRYWDINPELENSGGAILGSRIKQDEAKEKFMAIFEDSIRLRLRSDVPIAVHVSGGLDSTLMVAAIDKVNKGQGSLKAFSYYFDDKRYDERPFVEELVRKVSWDVGYCRLTAAEIPAITQEAMRYQEQPFPGVITLAKHKLVKETSNFGAKVILEGQGGDEIGAGYQYVFGIHLLDMIRDGNFRSVIGEIKSFGQENKLNFGKSFIKMINGLLAYYRIGRSADGTSFLKTHCLNRGFFQKYRHHIRFPRRFKSGLLNMQYRDIMHTKLQRILRACDRASMAYGRELRVPILDHRLVEFSFTLPGAFKIKNGIQRAFLREALKAFFPSKLVDIPKRAVVDPQREWLRNDLRPWVEDIIYSDSFKKRGFFNHIEVQKEYRKYVAKPENSNSFYIWQWLSLELWHRAFIDNNLEEQN